jgi:hypothetical protein
VCPIETILFISAEGLTTTKEKTMKIKINETNRQKIEDVLNKMQKGASARTHSFDSIEAEAVEAEEHLDHYGVLKKLRPRISVTFADMVQATSYKYSYESTQITITRGSTDWFLTDVSRIDGRPGDKDIWKVTADSAVLDFLRNKIVDDFCN